MSAGSILLLVAHDGFNSLKGQYCRTQWGASQNAEFIDVIQVICFDIRHEEKADVRFPDPDYRKYYDTDTVIYAHNSLEDGMYTSGYCITGEDKKVFREWLADTPCKFSSGLVLDQAQYLAGKMNSPLLHEEHEMYWNKIHASDLFENCFDGYTMVDMTNLHTLRVSFNNHIWLDLNRQQVQWLETTGMHYFPFLIHPFRIDNIDVHARWEQPTDYPEYKLSLWSDTSIPSSNLCGCGYYQKKDYKPPPSLEYAIKEEYAVRKELKLFYHNQNRRGKQAAFIRGRFHMYLSPQFCSRATKLLSKEGLHIPYDKTYTDKVAEDSV